LAWKRDLAHRAQALRRRMLQVRWSQPAFAGVERDIFVAAYAIRKLLEAKKKLSDEAESISVPAVAHQPWRQGVDLMNWHKISMYYDLEKSNPVNISLTNFCNQFIHSFVFAVVMGSSGGLEGVYVTSDHDRNKRLLYFSMNEITDVMLRVANDDIVESEARRDQETGEFRFVKKTSRRARKG
jgi:hypothetical protein